jgi:flagellar hook-basal body complex protein FliE
MFIQPMDTIDTLLKVNKVGMSEGKSTGNDADIAQDVQVPFKSIFEDAIKEVVNTDEQVNIDAEMLATGNSDNLHQYSIDIAKAQLSIDLLVELRNKALDSYSEVMRMSV